NLFLLLFSFVEIFLHLLINVETLVSFLIMILPLKITFLMSVAHPSITFVNFAKFVLLFSSPALSSDSKTDDKLFVIIIIIIDINFSVLLANSLVSSKLDYY